MQIYFHSITYYIINSNFGLVKSMVFKPELFKEPLKGEVQGFKGSIDVRLRSNREDVIINLIIKLNKYKDIKFVNISKFD